MLFILFISNDKDGEFRTNVQEFLKKFLKNRTFAA